MNTLPGHCRSSSSADDGTISTGSGGVDDTGRKSDNDMKFNDFFADRNNINIKE